jgi:hypothetical protein
VDEVRIAGYSTGSPAGSAKVIMIAVPLYRKWQREGDWVHPLAMSRPVDHPWIAGRFCFPTVVGARFLIRYLGRAWLRAKAVRCYCCDVDVRLARQVMLRAVVKYNPEAGDANSVAYTAFVEQMIAGRSCARCATTISTTKLAKQ